MLEGLFRQQVIDEQTQRLHGEVLVIPKISHVLVAIAITLWVILAVVWSMTNTYARKETVSGWLEPSEGLVKVFFNRGGIIKKVLVEEGEYVTEGQPLVVVNGDRVLADGEHLETLLLKEYQSQKTLLKQQLGRSSTTFQMRKSDIEQRISAGNEDLKLITEIQEILAMRYRSAKTNFEKLAKLHKAGHVSETEFVQAKGQYLVLLGEKQSIKRDQVNARNQIQQLETELQLLAEDNFDRRDQINTQLSDLAQEIARLHGDRAYLVKSPRSGFVSNLQAYEGKDAASGIPLLTVVPKDMALKVNLLVPVKASGFLKEGQKIQIRYDAFPYQKFGMYEGRITAVSDVVFLPSEITGAPIQVAEAVYRVKGELLAPHVTAYGKTLSLKSGMTISADIHQDRRSLLQWLFDPIYTLKGTL